MRFFTARNGIFIVAVSLLLSCGNNTSTPGTPSDTSLKAGGLYYFMSRDSQYMIAKVLVIDSAAFHVRLYSDKFPKKPDDIHSSSLSIAMSHAAVVRDGLQLSYKNLLKVEKVEDSELNGYRLYLEGKEPSPFQFHSN
jgi:hypothetical protein